MNKDYLISNLISEPLYMSRDSLTNILISGGPLAEIPQASEKEEKLELPEWIKSRDLETGKRLGKYLTVSEDGTATLKLHGPVYKGLDWKLLYSWYGSYADSIKIIDSDLVREEIQVALNDDSIKAVIVDVNSPGGMVVGTPELGDALQELKSKKPTISIVDTMAASAGMWIAAATGYIVASPSSRVGSVGVYLAFMDDSEYLKNLGLKLECIKSGRLKAIGLGELSDEQREFLQTGVNKMHIDFKNFVQSALNRKIDDELMQGQAIPAKDAVNSFVDELSNDPRKTAKEILTIFLDKE